MKLSSILVAGLFALSLSAAVIEAKCSKGNRSSSCRCGEDCQCTNCTC